MVKNVIGVNPTLMEDAQIRIEMRDNFYSIRCPHKKQDLSIDTFRFVNFFQFY